MKKEIKTVSCYGYCRNHSFSWEGSIIVYDNKYFEGIVRELIVNSNFEGKETITTMNEKDHPEGFIAGYILEDKIITFDKFPEAITPFDDIAFLSESYFSSSSEEYLKYFKNHYPNSPHGSFARGRFAPIMPCGNCPSFYRSLYHNKANGLT